MAAKLSVLQMADLEWLRDNSAVGGVHLTYNLSPCRTHFTPSHLHRTNPPVPSTSLTAPSLSACPQGSSEFWKRKMVTLFQLHDTDGDGRIDWTDYVRVQTRLCQNTDIGMKEEVETMLNFRVSALPRPGQTQREAQKEGFGRGRGAG